MRWPSCSRLWLTDVSCHLLIFQFTWSVTLTNQASSFLELPERHIDCHGNETNVIIWLLPTKNHRQNPFLSFCRLWSCWTKTFGRASWTTMMTWTSKTSWTLCRRRYVCSWVFLSCWLYKCPNPDYTRKGTCTSAEVLSKLKGGLCTAVSLWTCSHIDQPPADRSTHRNV